MIRILTDSASDILPAEAAQLGVDVIPLNVTLEDGTVIRDGVDLTPSEYYEHMAGCKKLPTTSQPSPELFEKFYAEAAAAGDEVVGIFLSHELSGTYQCAKLPQTAKAAQRRFFSIMILPPSARSYRTLSGPLPRLPSRARRRRAGSAHGWLCGPAAGPRRSQCRRGGTPDLR